MTPKLEFNHIMPFSIVSLRKLLMKGQIQVTVFQQVQPWSSPSHQEQLLVHLQAQVALQGQVTVVEQDLIQHISIGIVVGISVQLSSLWIVRHTAHRFGSSILTQLVGQEVMLLHRSQLKPIQCKKPPSM